MNEQLGPPVKRIDIADEARHEALEDLYLMNINAATIYPGLEGFAKSFQWRYELYLKKIN